MKISTPVAALAVLVLASVHLGLAFLPGTPFSPPMNAVLFAANLYTLYCAANVLPGRSGLQVVGFVGGYLALFALTVVLLDKKPLFVLLLVAYASVYGSKALLGLFGLFVLCFVVLQPYAFETFIPLAFVWVVTWRARGEASRFTLICLAAGLLSLATVLFPLIHLSLQDSAMTLWRTFQREEVRDALAVSLGSALLASVIVALYGVPLAYALARLDFPGRRVVESLIDLPILVPQSVAGVAFVVLLGPGSPLGRSLESSTGFHVSGSFVGLVIAQVFVASPFLVKTALTGFEAVPVQLELAARNLGATPWRAFFHVALPLARRSLLVGLALAFARAVSEFGCVILFASSPVSAPILVHTEFLRAGAADSRPIATLLLVTCLWAFLMLQLGATMMPFALRRPK
ncbi:MAG: hypothetical protein H6Q89_694 [Myxococcaceae bacterium]|nr:hypothetical protein [Myxococcaceae bacterium]